MADAPVTLISVLQLFREARIAEAIAVGRLLVAQEPANADAAGLLGMILQQNGNAAEALSHLTRAVALRPNGAALRLLRGVALRALAREEEAIGELRRAVDLQAGFADAHFELGNALKRLGRFAEAATNLAEATKLAPNNAAAWLNLGVAQLELGTLAEATASFRRAVQLEPTRAESHNVLGAALMEQGAVSAAQQAFLEALRLNPSYAAAHNNLARTYRAQGRLAEAVDEYRAALAISPDAGTHSNLCYALNFVADLPPEEVWKEHQAWGRRWSDGGGREGAGLAASKPSDGDGVAPANRALTSTATSESPALTSRATSETPGLTSRATSASEEGRRCLVAEPHAMRGARPQPADLAAVGDSGQKLRVGFVSPDLVNHAVAYFFEPLLAARNREEWTAICYSDAKVPDRTTARLRGLADEWRESAPLSDDQLEALIRRDGIDILVDLAGHTAHNRLRVFARKPARIQLTWLGYPNTTGLPDIDFRITDAISDPPGKTERWHAEKLLRLPHGFLCYLPPQDAPEIERSSLESPRPVTFASFSNFAKVSAPCLKTWAEILKKVPQSRLVLKSRGLSDAGTAERIHAQFQAHGITPERVILDGKLVSVAEHLRQYNAIDIALDPFPYNGTTTTCEALWMGVPVIPLAGETHVARVGASLLTHLGHTEWIAATDEEYIAKAVSLANDAQGRRKIHETLRDKMRRSPLCDAKGFAGDFTAALRGIWADCLKSI